MKLTHAGYVCLLAVLGCSPLPAETITGTVYDVTGAVVPKAAVTVINTATQAGNALASGEDGTFTAAGLAPGRFRIDVEARGFQAARESVSLKAGETARVSPVLQVGSVRETVTVTAKGTAAYSATPGKVRVGGNVEPVKMLRGPRAAYPESAKAQGITGSVLLNAVILSDGSVDHVTVIHSPSPELSASATDAVKQCRYQPATLNGQAIAVQSLVEIRFELVP